MSAVCLQAVAGQRIGLFSLLFFPRAWFCEVGRTDVLTEAPADRRVFFRHLCACAGWARVGGAAPYLFQMNYRGLLSYNGFFVSKVPS